MQGVDKSRQGDRADAIQIFDQVLQLDSSNANAYSYRCVARHWMGEQQGAIADCQQAAALYLVKGKKGASLCTQNAAKAPAGTTKAAGSLNTF